MACPLPDSIDVRGGKKRGAQRGLVKCGGDRVDDLQRLAIRLPGFFAPALDVQGVTEHGERLPQLRWVPGLPRNCHELYLRGAFGEATLRLSNLPLPDNPKSSYLTALAVLATLRRLARPLQIGG